MKFYIMISWSQFKYNQKEDGSSILRLLRQTDVLRWCENAFENGVAQLFRPVFGHHDLTFSNKSFCRNLKGRKHVVTKQRFRKILSIRHVKVWDTLYFQTKHTSLDFFANSCTYTVCVGQIMMRDRNRNRDLTDKTERGRKRSPKDR